MTAYKRIVLTGGGTTGHVSVNLALIPRLLADGWNVHYIASEAGIERELISEYPEVTYHPIATGKLRRYLSKENLKDIGRVFKGIRQAKKIIKEIRPSVIFSKGGYVSFPVVMGGRFSGVPSISHESDLTPGLANKMITPFVKKVMVTFEDSMQYIKKGKGFYLGPVIREQIKNGDAERGRRTYGFSGDKPILLVLGGSLGAGGINEAVWAYLDDLLEDYDILHGVGKGKGNSDISREGYIQVEYISGEMKDALAMADVIVSRAGANAIFEFLYYRKPMLLIPLPTNQSRGDQILNAREFEKKGYAKTLPEEELTPESFLSSIKNLRESRDEIVKAQSHFEFGDAVGIIIEELKKIQLKG